MKMSSFKRVVSEALVIITCRLVNIEDALVKIGGKDGVLIERSEGVREIGKLIKELENEIFRQKYP